MKVLVFTPRKGDLPEEYVEFRSQVENLQRLGAFGETKFVFKSLSGMSINMARNAGAHLARSNQMDKLLFLDTDILPTPENLIRLVSHDVPVVAGLYVKRNGHMSWLGRHLEGAETDPETGLVEYEDLPTGFMCIDVRKCLDPMIAKMPEIEFDAVDDPDAKAQQFSRMHEFFPMGITGPSSWREKFEDIKRAHEEIKDPEKLQWKIGEILKRRMGVRIFRGEDYHFCWLARKAGLKVYADWKCCVHHKGSAVYPLNPQFVVELADKIRAKLPEAPKEDEIPDFTTNEPSEKR